MPACRVTVAIPAYKPRFLDAALRSAFEQDCEGYEILVCDDCRTDAVAQIVQPYLNQPGGPTVRYIHNDEQLGEARNFAKCVELARGRYVKLLCDDDLILPGALRAQAAVLDANEGVSIVTSRRKLIDEHGNTLPDFVATLSPFDHDACVHGHDLVSFLADHILNFIGEPSCTLFRRDLLVPLGSELMALAGQPIEWLGDLAMHVNLMRQGHLAMLQEPGACFRITTDQGSQGARAQGDIGKKGRDDFTRKIRELGWYREAGNELVRIAQLASAEDFHYINLRTRVDRMWQGQPPVAQIEPWLARRVPSAPQLALIQERLAQAPTRPSFGIFVRDTGDTQSMARTMASLQAARQLCSEPQVTVVTVSAAAAQPHWTLAVNAQAAALAHCEWLLVVESGAEFTASGLLYLALELIDAAGCRAVYADGLARTDTGALGSLFRPGFNLDMLLSCPAAMARHWLVRRDVFLQAGGFDPAFADAPEFELLLRLIDAGGIDGLGHVSEPLLISALPSLASQPQEIAALQKHLRLRGYEQATIDASRPGRYRIHYGHGAMPLVSIIIPTKDQFAMVERCVSSLLEKTTYLNYEILLVDNQSTQPAACAWLDGLAAIDDPRIRVLRYPHPFNYSAINNVAASQARGEYLVLLNNDTAIVQGDWLDALLNHAQRPEVGIVGAKLLYPNGTIQHAGVVLGLRGPAEHPFNGLDASEPGYMQRLEIDQNYNVVTGACLMVRRALYEEVGGLDENDFKVSYNDVDLCLKVRDAGYLVVWTPHAMLLHEGSVSQKQVDQAVLSAKAERFQREQDAMYRKWLPVLAHDSAYNRNLSLQGAGFELETDPGLGWNPLPWRPLPVVLAMAADQQGCGHYRIIHPGRAMVAEGLADVRFSSRHYSPPEMERMQPDTWILQRQVSDAQIELIRRHAPFTQAFKVAELDDYLPNLPMKNAHREHMPKDILRALRRTVGLADRFVVSTEPLAEALAGLNPDTRVVHNRLPPAWWRGLQSSRRVGARPRVGWAGGASHQGDLELIIDVVKELKGEVDWVFFGMCPEPIRPYLHEFHGPVSIDRYPAMLARLNLDLALAPLEQNLFNECKSNLRLLEYGACGYPVVASDVKPYQGGLPVTLVKNRFKDWVDAIRAHTRDLDAAAAAGDRLKEQVHAHWMLEGAHVQRWLQAWLPG